MITKIKNKRDQNGRGAGGSQRQSVPLPLHDLQSAPRRPIEKEERRARDLRRRATHRGGEGMERREAAPATIVPSAALPTLDATAASPRRRSAAGGSALP